MSGKAWNDAYAAGWQWLVSLDCIHAAARRKDGGDHLDNNGPQLGAR